MAWIERGLIGYLRRKNPEQFGWLEDVTRVSPGIFWKFLFFAPLAGHRRATPKSLINLARIGALKVHDCGACLQVAVDYAVKDGLSADLIQAALWSSEALPPRESLVVGYAQAVAGKWPDLPQRIEAVRRELGEAVLAELALAVATASVFPVTKQGLGVANTCDLEAMRI